MAAKKENVEKCSKNNLKLRRMGSLKVKIKSLSISDTVDLGICSHHSIVNTLKSDVKFSHNFTYSV